MRHILLLSLTVLATTQVRAGEGNRLAYLDECNPYYPSRTFPKLITPMWVGEEGVDAVVVLAIDDMRGHEKWEQFLRPILNRLKKIDGRAPVSIMTCTIDPKHPHLQQWLKEGLSLEVHTIDHPCPLLQKGDLAKAKSTYDRCVDLMNLVPNNKPVAFRMPCCDSLNTLSPRFFTEIFNRTTPLAPVLRGEGMGVRGGGNFLSLDSSVFHLFTANDPDLPRDLVFDADGQERFRKYIPANRSFVNAIEDYPYPYVINRLCWEFPCMTPSDWQAQYLHKANNPITVRDWKAALDCTVIKKGVFSFVFHPHGWIQNEQIVDFIDYAQQKYGKRVKFLNFKECEERLTKNPGISGKRRDPKTGKFTGALGIDNSPDPLARIAPICIGPTQAFVSDGEDGPLVKVWTDKGFRKVGFTLPQGARVGNPEHDYGLRFVDLDGDGNDDVVFSNEKEYGVYLFTDMEHGWSRKVMAGKAGEPGALPMISRNGTNNGFWVHSRHLWWQNENTDLLPNLVDRRSFNDILKDVEPAAKSPEASLKSIQVKPGFQVELMAAEPLVQDPIAFAFAPDGKLWVVEMGDYPLGLDGKGKFGGKIKFLESTKGDGKFDKATVFLDGLGFPTGVLPWRNGILVTCSPEIFFVEIKDGKPGKKEVLFSGFNEGNQQHRVNTLAWGLDNWLYVANGDSGGTIKSHKTGKTVNISGRDLRIRPDTGEMEAVTGQTQYGRCRDDWGNWFGGNNSNPMWHYVLDDHYLKRNPHVVYPNPRSNVSVAPGAAPVFPISRTLPRFNDPGGANRFTSACSPIVYRDTLFFGEPGASATGAKTPVAYAPGSPVWTFVCEPVHNLIHREVMRPDGVTFKSQRAIDERQSEFLASTDNWFRPVRIETGPDGCLWIADMYRQVIEHPQWIPPDWQKRLDLRAGHDKGRIYRVVPVGVKPRAIPRLDKLDTKGLVAALDSPNGWQRDTAQMMLIWRNDKDAVPMLEKIVRESKNPLARLHALCTLDGVGKLAPEIVKSANFDNEPGVRRHALRLRREEFAPGNDIHNSFRDEVEALLKEQNAQVRLQLAYTLGDHTEPAAEGMLFVMLTNFHGDPFLRAAMLSSVSRDHLNGILNKIGQDGFGSENARDLLTIATGMNHHDAVAILIDGLCKPVRGAYDSKFAAASSILDTLDQRGVALDSESLKKLGAIFNSARMMAIDAKVNPNQRLAAVSLLAREPNELSKDIKMLTGFLIPQSSPELQTAAVASLGRVRQPAARQALLTNWKGIGPARRAQIVELLLRRDEGAAAILEAIEKRQINATEIDAPARQRLLTHKLADVRAKASKAFAGSIDADREKVVQSFRPALSLKGNAAKGREIYAKTCAACHKLNGVGNEVGPDLAALAGRSNEYLMIAILDPNRAVEARYVNYLAETKNGLSFTGVLLNETSTSITIVGPEGKSQTILRNNLESLTSTGRSAMPEGVEKDWKHQDMADLLAHLRGSGPALKPKEFPNNKPELVQAEADGSLSLKATNAEIYGPTLVFEQQHRNLGYWSKPDDLAIWSVRVPKAGKYAVWLDYACNNDNAGNTFAIETEGGTITSQVAGTRNWDTYRVTKVGEVTLHAGEQRVTMRSEGEIRGGAMIDLKSIRLIPVK